MSALAVHPIILCGGSGSRLWPLSRGAYPKHLLPLIGDKTLLQQTVERLAPLASGHPTVVTNADHAFLVNRQLAEIGVGGSRLIVEPVARGTAPAVALAAIDVARRDPEAIVLIAPSDHLVLKADAFAEAVAKAARLARAGHLSTIGVTATAPETGYGYIRRGGALGSDGFQVDSFVEKPDRARAEALIAAGDCDWNAGIFIASASVLLEEMARHAPAMLGAARAAIEQARESEGTVYPAIEALQDCPANSLDYAVMEHTERAAVVPADLGWSDLGSWSALWQVSDEQDEHGNVFIGDVAAVDTANCYVRASGNLVAVVGVQNLVVVASDDAVVVAARDRSEDIKAVVDRLRASGRSEVRTGTTVQHPWGSATVLEDSEAVRIRRLSIAPGAEMGEVRDRPYRVDWTVLSGQGEARLEGRGIALARGGRCFAEGAGALAVVNTGAGFLELVEVTARRTVDAEG